MEIDKKKEVLALIIGAVIVILVVLGFVFGWFRGSSATSKTGTGSPTASAVPAGTVVPSVGATSTPKDVAVPTVSIPAAPGATSQLRVFNIKADNGAFTPSTVIANQGDTIHINFTAVDKTYDIILPDYGMRQTATKGQTKVLEFQGSQSGKFAYYCDLCGNTPTSPNGYVIVVPAATSTAQ